VLHGLLFSVVPLIRWMPGLLFDGNEAEIRTFLERSLDIVIGHRVHQDAGQAQPRQQP